MVNRKNSLTELLLGGSVVGYSPGRRLGLGFKPIDLLYQPVAPLGVWGTSAAPSLSHSEL